MPPVFFLAFAYDPDRALPDVVRELGSIHRLLSDTGGNAQPVWQVRRDDMERMFDTQRDDLRLFHYSGHAGPDGLELNVEGGATRISFAGGLARLASLSPGLRLVFLNGCSTADQARAFLDRGIPAVITTSQPLIDRYGLEFARRFYENFTRRGSRNTLRQAFEIALDGFTETYGNDPALFDERLRSVYHFPASEGRPLYELHVHPEKEAIAGQRFSEWFEATEPTTTSLPTELQPAAPGPTPAGAPSQLLSAIRELVGQARLESALEKLIPMEPDAILLSGQLASARRDFYGGTMGDDEWRRTTARIARSILELAQRH